MSLERPGFVPGRSKKSVVDASVGRGLFICRGENTTRALLKAFEEIVK